MKENPRNIYICIKHSIKEKKMSAETILYIILSLLRADNAQDIDKPVVHKHLVEVSQAIKKHSTKSVPAVRLISLAYNESRFGYKEVQKDKYAHNKKGGACGIYQQIPKFSRIKTTCKKLGEDVDHASKAAVAYLTYMIDRWNIRGSKRMDNRMCHYFSGNSCDDNKDGKLNLKDGAMQYASRHRKIRLKALKEWRKIKRKGKKVKNAKRLSKTKSRHEMTRAEWLYALRNEQDENRRAELGLPPNKL